MDWPLILTWVFSIIAIVVSLWTIGFNMGSRR